LHAYTAAGAAALFREDAGVLRPGARPTFVVLSADPRSTPVQHWSQIRVEATYVDGVAVGTDEPVGVPPPGRPLPKW
ncbi:MAG: amidohydrolase family protein, partial [Geminicoccaceae bacterium]|nr:amidohydrolase family protein [Geminicoccaceae bacterium]